MHHLRRKSDDSKDNYYEDLGQVYGIEIPLGDFNAKLGRENIN
jgi:hypothetical protein